MRGGVGFEVPLISGLVAQLAQQSPHKLQQRLHTSSASCVATKGVSFNVTLREPPRTPDHTRIESTRMIATRIMKTAVTPASRRALKISAAVADVCGPFASFSACAKKPSAGALSKIFCHPAVKHTVTSQASGMQVTHT